MNIKLLFIFLLSALALTACINQPQPTENVDQVSLVRSMTYTHRNLLEVVLGAESEQVEGKRDVLLKSHCDLVDRGVVSASIETVGCHSPVDRSARLCIADFHRCIGVCPSFKQTCRRCEDQAEQCLVSAKAEL